MDRDERTHKPASIDKHDAAGNDYYGTLSSVPCHLDSLFPPCRIGEDGSLFAILRAISGAADGVDLATLAAEPNLRALDLRRSDAASADEEL